MITDLFYILLTVLLVLFAPGFFLSVIMFDLGKIDLIERIALSFGLSISVIPLLTFYFNLLGIKIGVGLVVIEVVVVSLAGVLVILYRNYRKK
jgi:uncharacterized membrane protein